MQLPSAVLATRDRYVTAFPLWSVAPSEEAEERARTWTLGLIAQVVFEHDASYGSKRADPGRPLSKDGLAQKQPDGRLFCWDLLTGAGSGSPQLVQAPDSMDITGQVFESVDGRDVIGGAPIDEGGESADVIPYDETYSVRFGTGCNAVYQECGAPIDPGMISVHSQRCAWDFYCGGLTQDESYEKHLNEFRQVYGLPPV